MTFSRLVDPVKRGAMRIVLCVLCASVVIPLFPETVPSLKLDEGAIIVWDTKARDYTSEFIIRIAQYSPERFFEWESRAHQGTIKIPAKILKEGKKLTFARLFDNGVDIDKTDSLTLWLSEQIYQELKTSNRARVTVDSLKDEFVLDESLQYPLLLNKQAVTVPALKVRDTRGATWIFLDSAVNPLMLEYQNQYYTQKIRSMTTKGSILRWVR
ncbi:MAG TPA: hypothetical protein VGK99_02425 [Acidobacteriota bacterium]|jgi:hypothetical protein